MEWLARNSLGVNARSYERTSPIWGKSAIYRPLDHRKRVELLPQVELRLELGHEKASAAGSISVVNATRLAQITALAKRYAT